MKATEEELKKELIQIRKRISQIGLEFVQTKTPIPLNEVLLIMQPFADIEKSIEKIVK